MAHDGFNGSRVTFPTTSNTIGSLRGITFDESAAEVSITSSTHTSHVVVAGITKAEVSLDLVGGSALVATSTGTSGDLDVTWNDTGLGGSLPKVQLVGKTVKGQMDGEITATLKFANASTV